MSDYTRNREIMAHTLAQKFVGRVPLLHDDGIDLKTFTSAQHDEIVKTMRAEYYNDVEVSMDAFRKDGAEKALDAALLKEFDDHIMYDCESWLRRFAKEERAA